MERIENPSLSRLILDHLSDLYKLKQKREGIHLSTLVYCLTRSFFDQLAPVEPTDSEVMLFSLGYGLQDVLTPADTYTPVYEKDGITFSPDFVFQIPPTELRSDGTVTYMPADAPPLRLVELKTTRMSSGKEDFPETWLEYIMGGCYMQGINEYELSVLHMLGNYRPPFPEIKSYKLIFDKDELEGNWDYLFARKVVFQSALEENKPPIPKKYCKDWECKNCRYRLQCDAILMVQATEEKEEEVDDTGGSL